MMPSPLRLALFIVVLSGLSALTTALAEDTKPLSAAEIPMWIEKLGSETYLVREKAMQRLAGVGIAALEPLAAAADGDNLEISVRAIRLMLQLSQSPDDAAALAAWNRLATLQNCPFESAKAIAVLGQIRATHALSEVRRLGAESPERFRFNESESGYLQLGQRWEGGNDGLVFLKELRGLIRLSIHGTPISDEGLEHLAQLRTLERLELFGTHISEKGIEQLRTQLPGVDIDFRNGAMLGVSGVATQLGVQITRVQATTAADEAGILVGDTVLRFNNQPIATFEELTSLIGRCRAGDKAELEIERDGQLLSKAVVFGGWK